ncbi:unnamed protein product, partial [Chrysoparadoxa australica]
GTEAGAAGQDTIEKLIQRLKAAEEENGELKSKYIASLSDVSQLQQAMEGGERAQASFSEMAQRFAELQVRSRENENALKAKEKEYQALISKLKIVVGKYKEAQATIAGIQGGDSHGEVIGALQARLREMAADLEKQSEDSKLKEERVAELTAKMSEATTEQEEQQQALKKKEEENGLLVSKLRQVVAQCKQLKKVVDT